MSDIRLSRGDGSDRSVVVIDVDDATIISKEASAVRVSFDGRQTWVTVGDNEFGSLLAYALVGSTIEADGRWIGRFARAQDVLAAKAEYARAVVEEARATTS